MYFTRAIVFLCLCIATAAAAYAQQYNIRSWTLEQGLPQSQVMAIQQDPKGYLWLATRAGLSRFNGIDFYTYTKDNGLSSHNISTLFIDSRHRLWIGTTDAGLQLFEGSRFERYGPSQGLQAQSVMGISEDSSGKIWLATNNGIFYLSSTSVVKYKELPEISYTAIAHTPSGDLWAGSQDSGVYNVSGTHLTHYSTSNSPLPHNQVTAITADKQGKVWIGTDQGLAKVNSGSLSLVQLPGQLNSSHITSFTHDRYQNLWIGLQRNGLLKYNGSKFTYLTRRSGLRTSRITALASDTEGNVWIGTNGYGVQQYRAPWFVHYFDFGTISEPRVTAVAQDSDNTMWFGTDEGELARMLPQGPQWHTPTPWPRGATIYSFLPVGEELWASTSNGIWRLGKGSPRRYAAAEGLPAPDVYEAATGPDGKLYFATAGGVVTLRQDSLKLIPAAEGNIRANTIFRDSKDRLWIGADQGIFLVKQDQLEQPRELKGLNLSEIRSITEDKNGNLYFAAFNTGLLLLQNQRATLYTSTEGLPNEAIKSLYADDSDNLWIATNRDLLKVQLPLLRQQGRFSYRTYTSPSGFRGLEVCDNAMLQTKDGHMWFGTTKGLTRYLPHLDRRNPAYPKMLLTDVLLYSNPTNWNALGYKLDSLTGLPVNLRLPHTQNHLSFNFHGISLSHPEQVMYKYRLKGYDDTWSQVTERSFTTYANLSPGTYTFELLARNLDGYWTPKPLTYTFSIVPPIWRREWFIGVLLLVVASAVLSVVRLRERSLVKMNSLLEMKVDHRTRLLERQNREKEILLQEIHHRVKNNLQIVISMLNLQARHVQDPAAQEVMQALRSRVRSMSLLHERLYRHNDLEQINLEEYFLEICESLYASYGISMDKIELELDIPYTKVDLDTAITLGLIVNELVSNTLKYAFPKGEHGILRIDLVKHDEVQYTLTVSDNGQGLPEDFFLRQQTDQSFGLKLVQSLSKKLDGNISFYNKYGTKSILYFVLPS
ncbi:ligand-binding sensor domain-containing protein [Pontibacter anaerobius]|uniref:histidine kinase n=1 Tax=Pontibacter anaerobius TaxID=2993940 RepID=A0ABT3RA57_9BACT|nr:two-component regulator propeller domain-containing protein [Pontibacter anaerobius]MCX2738469.1 triple tyrosine motif-containing protein [Pontibacter anaerobius]